VCIGNNFAMLEMQLILATSLQRYRLRLAAGHRVALKPEATLRPKYGMKMTLELV
jgi:cytochrome P450